jgi:hypothetical protein
VLVADQFSVETVPCVTVPCENDRLTAGGGTTTSVALALTGTPTEFVHARV